jgi:hypothetical protein
MESEGDWAAAGFEVNVIIRSGLPEQILSITLRALGILHFGQCQDLHVVGIITAVSESFLTPNIEPVPHFKTEAGREKFCGGVNGGEFDLKRVIKFPTFKEVLVFLFLCALSFIRQSLQPLN